MRFFRTKKEVSLRRTNGQPPYHDRYKTSIPWRQRNKCPDSQRCTAAAAVWLSLVYPSKQHLHIIHWTSDSHASLIDLGIPANDLSSTETRGIGRNAAQDARSPDTGTGGNDPQFRKNYYVHSWGRRPNGPRRIAKKRKGQHRGILFVKRYHSTSKTLLHFEFQSSKMST
ncbi:hypothetical protein SCHPADRAFT_296558 [Schizopora paradoxa]|uniref:Uncharacterized protein n=1 Tax=Schizopora paradoxa TaxID=27342 RepID=A0A0H2RRV8_9AGAM|nr:hypothetical protein SCHPADRAFT_296558 [Schizopora paradoxa]